MSNEPTELLASLIGLIGADINRLQRLSDANRRPRAYSSDLMRYSKTLLDIITHLKQTENEQTQAVKRLSNEELETLAREALSQVSK